MPTAAPRRRRKRRRLLVVIIAVLVLLLLAVGAYVAQTERVQKKVRFSPAYSRLWELPLLDRVLPRPVLHRRLVTGIAVGGTAERPVLYVSSSDPRIAGVDPGVPSGDTNSGVVSRLTREGDGWKHEQLVRGLPRSRLDHAPNGLVLDEDAGALYLAIGSMTNLGSPSADFDYAPEYALAGGILRFDLEALGRPPYDLPTLDDPTRDGDPDAGDPFGGHDGLNQARLTDDGPVRLHTSGLRNPYDLHLTRSGRLYVTVNGANRAVGGPPRTNGGSCTNDPQEGGTDRRDSLRDVTEPGVYGGHPSPTRAGARFHPEQVESPVEEPDPGECRELPLSEVEGLLATFDASTNGLTEYTASALGGALAGDLLTVSFDGSLTRVDPSARGAQARSVLYPRFGVIPLDVTAVGDGGRFAGSIWAVDWALGRVLVLEPRSAPCEVLSKACFRRSELRGATPEMPTSLAWGPDGRLYVSEQDGLLRIYTVERDAAGVLAVVDTETIAAVRDLPNHDDDGRPAARLPLID